MKKKTLYRNIAITAFLAGLALLAMLLVSVIHGGITAQAFEVVDSPESYAARILAVETPLRIILTYQDLVSFYMANADQTEGEGMGLVMNLLLLKGENINPGLFRVGMRDGKTMARIEIPFTDNFKSVRGPDPGGFTHRENDINLDFRS